MPAYKKYGALMGVCIAFAIATLDIVFTVQDGELYCYYVRFTEIDGTDARDV